MAGKRLWARSLFPEKPGSPQFVPEIRSRNSFPKTISGIRGRETNRGVSHRSWNLTAASNPARRSLWYKPRSVNPGARPKTSSLNFGTALTANEASKVLPPAPDASTVTNTSTSDPSISPAPEKWMGQIFSPVRSPRVSGSDVVRELRTGTRLAGSRVRVPPRRSRTRPRRTPPLLPRLAGSGGWILI